MTGKDALAGSSPLVGGDVLLYRGHGWISRAIRFFDGSDVSHASLYLGAGRVGEALPEGLRERALAESVAGAEWVLARRLKSGAAPAPVLERARRYLDEGPRYGYEQILLLAVLTVTRRLRATRSLKRLVRLVLDRAANVLAEMIARATGGEPMICSEFVYRCYDEAMPEPDDPYSLSVGGLRTLADTAAAARPVPGRGVDPESLLAAACRPAVRDALKGQRRAGGRAALPGTDADLEEAFEHYVDEARAASTRAPASAAAVLDADLLAALERFAGRFVALRRGVPGSDAEAPATRDVPDALASFFRIAANFVTPGDLLACDSLFELGRLGGETRVRTAAVRTATAAQRRALVVGINRYADPGANLNGCVNDALMVAELLAGANGFRRDDIRLLTDERATTRGIRTRLDWLVRGAGPGSVLVFHFSGHGSQVRDRGRQDELEDGVDEILCPHDLDWDDPLTDDELGDLVAGLGGGVNLTVILDCCHSGTGLREYFKEPGAESEPVGRFLVPPPDVGFRAAAGVRVEPGGERGRTVNMAGVRVPRRRRFAMRLADRGEAVLLAGCRSDQTAADAWIDADHHGAFTYSLWQALDGTAGLTYAQLHERSGRWLADNGFDQEPQLEAAPAVHELPFLAPLRGTVASRPAGRARARGTTAMR